MTPEKRFIAVEGERPAVPQAPAGADFAEDSAPAWDADEAPDESPDRSRQRWAMLGLALLVGWTGFCLVDAVAHHGDWNARIAGWAGPVLALGLLWLIVQRSSLREAARYAGAARMLGRESARLEERLTAVNRELSLAREFLAAQTRELESLGRLATERLSHNADRLQALIRDNGAQLDAIGSVSAGALDNMERLRGQLPVLTGSAKDLANNIGQAGLVAQSQVEQLAGGLQRLTDFNTHSQFQVADLHRQLDAALTGLEHRAEALDGSLAARLDTLDARGRALHGQWREQHDEATALLATRAEALATEIAASRARLDEEEAATLTSLRARLAALRDEGGTIARTLREGEAAALTDWRAASAHLDIEISRRREAQAAQFAMLERDGEALLARLAAIEAGTRAIAEAGRLVEADLDSRLTLIGTRIGDSAQALVATDGTIARLTDGSVRLLELIQAAARHSREDLTAAIARGDASLAEIEVRAAQLRDVVAAAEHSGAALVEHLHTGEASVASAHSTLAAMHKAALRQGEAHGEQLDGLHRSLAALQEESEVAAARAGEDLRAAIDALTAAARAAIAEIDAQGRAAIPAVAERMAAESSGAVEKALRLHLAELSGKLEATAARAAGIAQEATGHMQRQLAEVGELIAHLENRIDAARTRAEERVDHDFSRRAAAITESLNSNAIDIARALHSDVTDVAWAAYLRGDRGVFTRRAVRLLDNGEAKSIVQLFEGDYAFREHVSQYIHDFEAMLRQLLATRDGHALGVTLLSSDMGKLYVALAQAIERLRG